MKIFFKLFTRIHIALFRVSGGAAGSRMRGMPVLLLGTRGRKTGKKWTTPVMYLEDAGEYIMAASNNGMNRHPAWYLNLKSTPRVEVEIRGGKFKAEASDVQDGEYSRLWETLTSRAPFFEGYKTNRSLPIPLVRLSPIK